jgi:beta-glucosidase/6-phospho-beta-glucosidase/beta-galactosidase
MKWWIGGLVGVMACGPSLERPFPDGFMWGAATAGFQVDMGCPTWSDAECVDSNSDWYQWVTTDSIIEDDGLFVAGDPVSVGPGMWELFEEDVDRMASDGMNTYRMSLEWSRLFPDGAAESAGSIDDLDEYVNESARQRYHEMFEALIAAEISPLVTVNHYTMPLWVHDGVACHEDLETCTASGWVDRDRILPLMTLFTSWVAREYGGEVDRWATLNEPFATTLSGYVLPSEDRSSPPGRSLEDSAAVAVAVHQVEGHAMMYDALHELDTLDADGDGVAADVGIVMNMVAIRPLDPESEADVLGADHMDYLYHRLYLDALTTGQWDDNIDGVADRTRDDLANRLDWIGVNYYNRVTVTGWGIQLLPSIPVFDFFPEVSWDIYPEGMADVLRIAGEYDLPVIVTENGTNITESASEALEGHLDNVYVAIDEGVDVRGYLYWTLVDNYEWNHGMAWRMGLYELDDDTKERIPRPVLERMRQVMAQNGLE